MSDDEQEPVLDPEEARRVTEEAVARNDAHNQALAAEYDTFIRRAAHKHPELTADDVWAVRGGVPGLASEASALGPAMRRAVKEGVIERLPGEYENSSRPKAHQKPLPLYRSLVFKVKRVRRVETLPEDDTDG